MKLKNSIYIIYFITFFLTEFNINSNEFIAPKSDPNDLNDGMTMLNIHQEINKGPDYFIDLVNRVGTKKKLDFIKSIFGMVWLEQRWCAAVAVSLIGGMQSIELLTSELGNILKLSEGSVTAGLDHWNIAYQEILVEALALIQPDNEKERDSIVEALIKVSEFPVKFMVNAKRLAIHILENYSFPIIKGKHNANNHKIFIKYLLARKESNDYTFATKEDSRQTFGVTDFDKPEQFNMKEMSA